MPEVLADFSARLRSALTGAPDTPLVLLGNIEVEEQWAEGEVGLPRIAVRGNAAVVNRMDELALLLAGAGDYVVLKSAPEDDYLRYLESLGLALPNVLAVTGQDPMRTVTQDALLDQPLIDALGRLVDSGARIWPHGVSLLEERLAARSGLPLAGADSATCKSVNSKIYSRTIADDLGLCQPRGLCCRSMTEFAAACEEVSGWLAAGRTVVLKDAFGVSGRGILVVRDEASLRRVERMMVRRATRTGREDLALVVEEWVDKRADLNYQFTVARDGVVRFDFVKEALTESGVHQGHRMPARLTAAQTDTLEKAAQLLGRRLAADGYFGVVGVDALLGVDDEVFPVLEINARNNMSTYQERLQPFFLDDGAVLATRYPLRLTQRLAFSELRTAMDGLLLEPGRRTGVLVNNFATVNAAAPALEAADGTTMFEGRLYAVVVGSTEAEVTALDRAMRARMTALGSER
ncbi:ATP-grasp domain-containing protein [Sinosporangium album]|uniref:ATP-grasp domain-containing protein n=1 Tax=Sinosporangium album TaxID=504805 RepID=A0A1G8A7I5_9ACTN|nr:ATP-grasp domain-containing protein [Sinosporangium album]SDH16889.1 ATP-grasp domain-containing protein [Sinosporangium album]